MDSAMCSSAMVFVGYLIEHIQLCPLLRLSPLSLYVTLPLWRGQGSLVAQWGKQEAGEEDEEGKGGKGYEGFE